MLDLVKNAAQGKDVHHTHSRCGVDCRVGIENLGCHEARGSTMADWRVDKAEVYDDWAVLHIPSILFDFNHDVVRLEVPVVDAVAVKEADSFEQASKKVNPLHV